MNKLDQALYDMCKKLRIPRKWLHIGGAYGFTYIQMYYHTGEELTTAVTTIYSGTRGECTRALQYAAGHMVYPPSDAVHVPATLKYQAKRQRQRIRDEQKRRVLKALIQTHQTPLEL